VWRGSNVVSLRRMRPGGGWPPCMRWVRQWRSAGQRFSPCTSGACSLTPMGKPPPLAVRLVEALPFQRAQGERRGARSARLPACSRWRLCPCPCRHGLW
jgi:hypothetical protein